MAENLLHVKIHLNFGSLPKKHFTTQETEGLHRTIYNNVLGSCLEHFSV
jgi:hypothetical protein